MKTLLKFLEEKGLTRESFDALSDAEQRKIHNELSEANQKAFNALKEKLDKLEDSSTKESIVKQIEEAAAVLDKANREKSDNLMKVIDNHGLAITKLMKDGSGKDATPTGKTQLLKFLTGEDVKVDIIDKANKGEVSEVEVKGNWIEDKLNNKEAGMKGMAIKAAALMTTANVIPNVTDGFNQLFGNYIDETIHVSPKPDNYILPLVNVIFQEGTESIWYVERVNEEGDAEFIGEGDTKPLIDAEWQEKKADIKEVAERWKMSNRVIRNAPRVVSDFREHANELMDQKIDDGVAAGDGTGDNLSGVTTLASSFTAPTQLANFYQNPNIYDVIIAVATTVRLNNFKGRIVAVLNTVWEAKMKALKDADDRYIIPPFVSPDGTVVGSVEVKFTNKIADTHILCGELKRFNAVISQNVMYFEGWENDDFSKNLQSRKLEAFLGTYLPANYAGSIVYDAIATILTAIAET